MVNKKLKILIIILVFGIILIGGWWIWNTQTSKLNCSKITSMHRIEKCVGEKIKATGILECEKLNVPIKAGVHYLIFNDGTELRFLEGYSSCQSYNAKKVTVMGKLYQCGGLDQCAGIGLTDIESVKLVD